MCNVCERHCTVHCPLITSVQVNDVSLVNLQHKDGVSVLRQARGMVTLTVRRNRTQVLVPVLILVSVYILCQLNSSIYAHLPRSICLGLIIAGLIMRSIYNIIFSGLLQKCFLFG